MISYVITRAASGLLGRVVYPLLKTIGGTVDHISAGQYKGLIKLRWTISACRLLLPTANVESTNTPGFCPPYLI